MEMESGGGESTKEKLEIKERKMPKKALKERIEVKNRGTVPLEVGEKVPPSKCTT